MKAAVEISAEERATLGKGAARAARRNGQIPVVLYSNGKENVSLNVEARVLSNEYFKGGFMNKLVALKTSKKSYFAVPRDIQLNPVSDKIEHADFLSVEESSVVKVFIPLHFKNVEKSPGIKRGGVFNVERHSLELFCPVKAIPAFIDIDVGVMEIGMSIHTSNITLPQGVSVVVKGKDLTIASIAGRKEEKEEAPVAAAAVAGADSVAGAAAPAAGAAAGAAGKAAAPAAAAKAPAGKDKK